MRREFGVAIGLPEPIHSELQGWRERLGDPNAAAIPPHITLLPPTALHEDELAEVEEHLRIIAAGEEPFDVHLRGSSTFRPVSPVVFVPLAVGISGCERVEQKVRSGPLSRELGFPYHPHVTVAHVDDDVVLDRAFEELAAFDCAYLVEAFHLYVHDADLGWKATRDYPLTGPTP
jgi:2'-5' RNA ligase